MGLSGTAITPVATYTPDVYPPASGTAVLAADVEATGQNLANRWAWLLAQPRVVEVCHAVTDDDHSPLTYPVVGTHVQVGGAYTDAVKLYDFTGLKGADVIHVETSFYVGTLAGGGCTIRLGNAAKNLKIPSCAVEQRVAEWNGVKVPVHLSATFAVTSIMITAGALALYLQQAGEPLTLTVYGPLDFTATIYRTGL